MLAIPLPFLVSVFLALLLVRMMRDGGRLVWFLFFVGACTLQSLLVGLRWSVDPGWVHIVQPVFAACLPPLAWAAFLSLRQQRPSALQLLWPFSVAACYWLLPAIVDFLLVAEFLLYGIGILRLDFPDGILPRVRIGDEWTVFQAQRGVAALLILSALVDALVSVALAHGDMGLAASAIAALMSILLVGAAGAVLSRAGRAVPAEAEPEALEDTAAAPADVVEEQAILAIVIPLLERGLYKDYDLTLQRLARRAHVPARKISAAINRLKGCSVTDLVNGYRVQEAERLLRETDLPVTQVMLEAGFQTKSNFNRVFKAVAGVSPTDYRLSGNE
jgi:AraC-like DNA-binding protein